MITRLEGVIMCICMLLIFAIIGFFSFYLDKKRCKQMNAFEKPCMDDVQTILRNLL